MPEEYQADGTRKDVVALERLRADIALLAQRFEDLDINNRMRKVEEFQARAPDWGNFEDFKKELKERISVVEIKEDACTISHNQLYGQFNVAWKVALALVGIIGGMTLKMFIESFSHHPPIVKSTQALYTITGEATHTVIQGGGIVMEVILNQVVLLVVTVCGIFLARYLKSKYDIDIGNRVEYIIRIASEDGVSHAEEAKSRALKGIEDTSGILKGNNIDYSTLEGIAIAHAKETALNLAKHSGKSVLKKVMSTVEGASGAGLLSSGIRGILGAIR